MNNTQNQVYFKQLNGIRFIAVMLVLIDHWFAESLILPLGHLGVVIFFVLSGFLITRILFIYKDTIPKQSTAQALGKFIIRRCLRIFPIYFLVCFWGIIFNISPIREIWVWMFTYSSNLYIIYKKTWLGVWDHFWSLAVEEQYYLLFPIIVFYLNKHIFKKLFYLMIFAGIFFRIYFYFSNDVNFRQEYWFINNVNLGSSLDCFGFGALLAYSYNYNSFHISKFLNNYSLAISFVFVIANLLINQIVKFSHGNLLFTVFERLIFNLFSFQLIGMAIKENKNYFSAFLECKIIHYLGSISYGMYVYHNFIYNYFHNEGNTLYWFLNKNLDLSNYSFFHNHYLLFLLNFVFLVVISTLSWFCIESPINSLKKYFE